MQLFIRSNGQDILETNYWFTPHARRGLFYLSWNPGTARLLVPAAVDAQLDEMRTAKLVIVSHGRWREHGERDALEILFDDGSDNPFALHLGLEQTDRLPPQTEHGRSLVFTAWTQEGEQLRLPARYRVVVEIPCLQPWEG